MATGEDAAMIATIATILFSLTVLGWAILYKCSGATMDPKDFDLNKCLGVLLPPPKKSTSDKPTKDTLTGENLISKKIYETVDEQDDAGDEDYEFIKKFEEMDTKIIGNDYTDIAARTIGECAKICFENQVGVGSNNGQCGGFISEYKDKTSEQDRVMCRMYAKGDLSDSTIKTYLTRSFYLKGDTINTI